MILKINPKLVTAINEDHSFVSELINSDLTITLYNKDGQIYTSVFDAMPATLESADDLTFKNQNDYGIESKVYYNDAIILSIPFTFISDNAVIGIRLEYNSLVLYKSFIIFGYDKEIDLYIMNTDLSEEALATFFVIDSPISNVKNLYKSNNSKSTSDIYTVDNKTYNDKDVSIQVNEDTTAYLKSKYIKSSGGIIITSTNVSQVQTIEYFNIIPNIIVQKNITDRTHIENEVSYSVNIDLSNQKKLYVDTVEQLIGRKCAVEVKTYDNSMLLLSHHVEVLEVINVLSQAFDTPSITVNTSGKHFIETIYHIFGDDTLGKITKYEAGNYIVAYSGDGTYTIGEEVIIPPDVTVFKSSTLTLIPVYKTESNLVVGTFYREPYTITPSNIQFYSGEGSIVVEVDDNYTPVKSIYSKQFDDSFEVNELFKIEQTSTSDYKIYNISDSILYVELSKISENDSSILQLNELNSLDNLDISLVDGVFNIRVFTSEKANAYNKNVIIINYPTVLKAEMNFISILLDDAIGKDIDYRTFYDFTAFNFLTDIFYKIAINVENFYYIYSDTISDDILKQLYSVDNILSRIKEYISDYDRKRS